MLVWYFEADTGSDRAFLLVQVGAAVCGVLGSLLPRWLWFWEEGADSDHAFCLVQVRAWVPYVLVL